MIYHQIITCVNLISNQLYYCRINIHNCIFIIIFILFITLLSIKVDSCYFNYTDYGYANFYCESLCLLDKVFNKFYVIEY